MSDDGKPTSNSGGGDSAMTPTSSAIGGESQHPSRADHSNTVSNHNRSEAPKFLRIDVDRWVELLFTFAIMAATFVNVYVANRQWSAMAENNAIAHESFASVQRAFITIDGLDITPLKSAEGGEITHWMFKTIIKNSGNTPTKNMRWGLGGEGAGTTGEPITIAPGLPLPSTAHDPDMMYDTLMKIHKFPRALLGPQSRLPVDIGGFGIPLVELRKISRRDAAYFIVASIHYYDVFKDSPEHITKSCFRVGATIEADNTIKPSYGLCTHWNCADSECDNDRVEYEEEMATKPTPSPVPAPAP